MRIARENIAGEGGVVLDNGSGILKVGFAGDDLPTSVFPSVIGKTKYSRVMPSTMDKDIYVGNEADKYRGLLTIKYPIVHGVVEDWLSVELLWQEAFDSIKSRPEERPLLLTEAPLNPYRNREKSAEILFETFGIPALFVSAQAVLALYSTGRTTGIVLDIGDGVSHAVPVVEGFAIPTAITRSDVAGRDITNQLAFLLRRRGHIFHSSSELEVVRSIKEEIGFVASNAYKTDIESDPGLVGGVSYLLPDGSSLLVGSERFKCAEPLFNPLQIGYEYPGAHSLVATAIKSCDLHLRKQLYEQIILSGGSTMFPGFGERLLNELKRIVPKDAKIRIAAPPERKLSTWIGGSILASLSSFKNLWVTQKEYDEHGFSALLRRII